MAIEMMHVDGLVSGPLASLLEAPSTTQSAGVRTAATSDWRTQLPVLHGHGVHLRELRTSDAASLFALMTTEEVARFISPPPTTVEGFVRFIEWTQQRRADGKHVCFAVVPEGSDTAVGLIQFHAVERDFSVAEWGFALGSAWWGKGLFMESAQLVLEFAFDQVGVRRMEARAVTENGRGNGALRKLGAVREAELRFSFAKGVRRYNQYLWSILDQDWRRAKFTWDGGTMVVH
jgi:[ribosomal protein S5]-alanine N-acetyltransferase